MNTPLLKYQIIRVSINAFRITIFKTITYMDFVKTCFRFPEKYM